MKAILLAAGQGRRLSPARPDLPKCLLVLGGRPLLARLLRSLARAGVPEAVVVVGYRREQVEKCLQIWSEGVRTRCIFNPHWQKGAILSLWAARGEFDDDLLIMDGDVLCPDEMVARLVHSPQANCFLLDGRVQEGHEEMILGVRDGRVLDIGRGLAAAGFEIAGESVGFFKVARDALATLTRALEECLAAGREHAEHEEAYARFVREQPVGFERVDDLPWTEIDFPEDLERAEREVLPKIDGRP